MRWPCAGQRVSFLVSFYFDQGSQRKKYSAGRRIVPAIAFFLLRFLCLKKQKFRQLRTMALFLILFLALQKKNRHFRYSSEKEGIPFCMNILRLCKPKNIPADSTKSPPRPVEKCNCTLSISMDI